MSEFPQGPQLGDLTDAKVSKTNRRRRWPKQTAHLVLEWKSRGLAGRKAEGRKAVSEYTQQAQQRGATVERQPIEHPVPPNTHSVYANSPSHKPHMS